MTGFRDTIRAGAGWASLAALGLALGIALHLMKSDRKVAGVESSWFLGTGKVANPAAVPEIGGVEGLLPKLPPFALRATIVATDPAQSTAIFDLGKGQIYSLRPGSSLPGVGLLLGVAEKSVQIEVNGRSVLFTFNDSTLGPGEVLAPIQSLAREIMANGPEGAVLQEASSPTAAAKVFVVPLSAPRFTDAPADEPELNATPRPGQTIDTTVWD